MTTQVSTFPSSVTASDAAAVSWTDVAAVRAHRRQLSRDLVAVRELAEKKGVAEFLNANRAELKLQWLPAELSIDSQAARRLELNEAIGRADAGILTAIEWVERAAETRDLLLKQLAEARSDVADLHVVIAALRRDYAELKRRRRK